MQIIRDTREQNGFEFSMKGVDVISEGLKCGDYTTSLLKDRAAVERKASTGEIYGNLCKTTNKARFFRELDNLKKLDHAIIVMEFPKSYMHSFPMFSTLPKFRQEDAGLGLGEWGYIKASAGYLRKCLHEVEDYGIQIKFCESKNDAEDFVFEWLKNLEEKYERNVPS